MAVETINEEFQREVRRILETYFPGASDELVRVFVNEVMLAVHARDKKLVQALRTL